MIHDIPPLSMEEQRSKTLFHAIATTILLGVVFLIPVATIKALAVLPLVAVSWKFMFHGSTVISMTLRGKARRIFQILFSVAVPLIFGSYFVMTLRSVSPVPLKTVVLWQLDDLGFLELILLTGLITYVSWALGGLLNRDQPFRGFLIACTIIFAICFFSYSRGYFVPGEFFMDVAASYAAMVMRMRRDEHRKSHQLNRMPEESRQRLIRIEKALNRRLTEKEFEAWIALEQSDSLCLKVISEYGACLEKTAARLSAKEGELPFPKEWIQLAILVELLREKDELRCRALENGLMSLHTFLSDEEYKIIGLFHNSVMQTLEDVRKEGFQADTIAHRILQHDPGERCLFEFGKRMEQRGNECLRLLEALKKAQEGNCNDKNPSS